MTEKQTLPTSGDAAEKRQKRILWVLVSLLSAGVIGILFWFSEPPPPPSITIATGGKKGAYYAYGKLYAKLLRKRGLSVHVMSTAGSSQNLKLLQQKTVDLAFVQTGVVMPQQKNNEYKHLTSLAAVYSEPLWVFYRSDQTINYLKDFVGKRVCIGGKGSGTASVALRLFKSNGLTKKNTKLLYCKSKDVPKMMRQKRIDVAFFIASAKSKNVLTMLENKHTKLMSFTRYRSYERQVDFVRAVKIWEGSISLKHNIPKQNVLLLASSATLAARQDTHPQVVTAILDAATEIHKRGNLVDPADTFPKMKGLDFPLHSAAITFKHSGRGFLAKTLPFWVLRLLARLKIVLLPLLTIFLPAFKLLPLLYKMRVKELLKKHYQMLQACENQIEAETTIEGVEKGLQALIHLRGELARTSKSVPSAYQHELYHWRLHLNLIKRLTEERLADMKADQPALPHDTSIHQPTSPDPTHSNADNRWFSAPVEGKKS